MLFDDTPAPTCEKERADWLREKIIDSGKKLYHAGINQSTDGNTSVRFDRNHYLITASGVHKGFMRKEHILLIDKNGNIVDKNTTFRVSAEFRLHLALYEANPELGAIVHAHSTNAIALALTDIDAYNNSYISVPPIPVTSYAGAASEDTPKVVVPFAHDYPWAILPRHGAVSWGKSIENAHNWMERLDHAANVMLIAAASGSLRPMSVDDRNTLLALFKAGYG